MADVADLDAAVAEARREALDLLARVAQALAQALDAFDTLMQPDAEHGSPVEWPLPDPLVLERMQLAAFVAVTEDMVVERRAAFRQAYAARLAEVRQRSGQFATFELSTSPVLPETKAAASELRAGLEDVRRAALFDRDLRDALRPLMVPWAWTW